MAEVTNDIIDLGFLIWEQLCESMKKVYVSYVKNSLNKYFESFASLLSSPYFWTGQQIDFMKHYFLQINRFVSFAFLDFNISVVRCWMLNRTISG